MKKYLEKVKIEIFKQLKKIPRSSIAKKKFND